MTTLGRDSVTTPVENSLRPARRFQFGVFDVDVSSGDVRKQGSKIKLQEKPFQLLVLLLEHAAGLLLVKSCARDFGQQIRSWILMQTSRPR